MNTDDDGDVVTVALGVFAGFEASACCIQHIKNNTGGEGKSSVKAEANGIAINS